MLSTPSDSLDAYRQLEALLYAARELNSAHDLPTALQAILLSMNKVMPFTFAAVLLPDHTAGTLDVMGSIGPQNPTISLPAGPTLKIPFGQGISGHVFATGEPSIAQDVRTFPGYLDTGLDEVRAEMAVPLKRGDSIVGVLNVGRDTLDAFSLHDLDLLSLFASQAAIAIENARLFSEQRRRVEELLAIQSIIEKITPHHDPPTIAHLIREELKALIDYSECRIFLLDPSSNSLHALGEPDPVSQDGSAGGGVDVALVGEQLAGLVVFHEQSDIIADARMDARLQAAGDDIDGPISLLGAPMAHGEHVRGAMTLSKRGIHQFDENARRLLEIVAAQAAMAFDRARLYDELRMQAITDPVVKLHNRRYLMERFREERARAVRQRTPLACLMLDIDRFKQVNDTYGHDAGDAVLREIALLLRRVLRREDIAARYGGEEFCILLPGSSAEEAGIVGERVRRAVERHQVSAYADIGSVSVSIGLAFLRDDDTGTEIFTRADAAMYTAKAAGGNGLVTG